MIWGLSKEFRFLAWDLGLGARTWTPRLEFGCQARDLCLQDRIQAADGIRASDISI